MGNFMFCDIMKFIFGQYRGQEVEKVALTDYLYFFWALKEADVPKNNPSFRRELERVRGRLNNYVSAVNCSHCKTTPARILAVPLDDRDGCLAPDIVTPFCDQQDCISYFYSSSGNIFLPIQYDSIVRANSFSIMGKKVPGDVAKNLQRHLSRTIGYKGRLEDLTDELARQLIQNLPIRGEQISLF